MSSSQLTVSDVRPHTRWNGRLVGLVAVLVLVNFMVDTAIVGPLIVLPEMLDYFGTDQAAWLNASALLAGVMWAPLLGRAADVHGKRRVLVLTLLLSCAGAVLCAVAPTIWLFIPGRLLQGAAVGAMFLSVAIVRDVCASRLAMLVVGIVTSGSAVLNIVQRFLIESLAETFGFQILFVLSAAVAAVMAVCVRTLVPESPTRTPGRIDVGGALLLGAGLAGALSYVSLGSEFGWLSVGPLALLVAGAAALARWSLVSSRKPDALLDVRNLGAPLVLTLLVVVLGAGSYQSMLQLLSIVAGAPADHGLGYGLAGQGSVALMLATAGVGVSMGGPVAGAIAARVGPAPTLVGGIAIGTVGTVGMFAGVSSYPAAICFAFLLRLTAGTLGTSGFNMAGSLASAERQGVVSSLVMVMVSIGSVALEFIGSAVLASTQVAVDGVVTNSRAGVFGYLTIALVAFVAVAVLAVVLLRRFARRPVAGEPRN